VKTFQCPSDNSDNVTPTTGVFAYITTVPGSVTGATFGPDQPTLGRTNYTANAGALGRTGDTFWDQWTGPYFVDSRMKTIQITDGSSNTLAFGEMLGGNGGPNRDFVASWMGTGALPTAWSTIDPGQWYSFGSKHTGVVQFAFGDGSVRSIRKIGPDTDWYSARWYQWIYITGATDGQVNNFDNL
jgi:hypothetical protein